MTTTSEVELTTTDERTRGSTTILLEERAENHWLATQGGVPVEGHGETAAEAAAEYCRKVGAMDE